RGLRGAGVVVVRLELVVVAEEEMIPVGRDAERAGTRELPLRDQRAFAGRGVGAIEVGGRALVIGDVATHVATNGPAAVLTDVDLAHRRIGELHERRITNVERLAICE